MENIEKDLATIKETLVFLVEQEKVRGEEVQALRGMIDAVKNSMEEQIIKPALAFQEESEFNDFNEKYGEKLGKYDDLMSKTLNKPDYSGAREAWNELKAYPEEEKENLDVDSYVEGVAEGFEAYVADVREQLGLPEDAPVEVKDDGNGNLEVKADTDGDGEVEDVTEEVTAPAEASEESGEEAPEEAEAPATEDEVVEEEDELEIDPELAKELEAYASK